MLPWEQEDKSKQWLCQLREIKVSNCLKKNYLAFSQTSTQESVQKQEIQATLCETLAVNVQHTCYSCPPLEGISHRLLLFSDSGTESQYIFILNDSLFIIITLELLNIINTMFSLNDAKHLQDHDLYSPVQLGYISMFQ